jgi:MFS transporter, BCD family, chlorophyll transporter
MSFSLRLDGVSVDVGDKRILDGVDLEVPGGAIVAIIGPNGAGKTTLLDAISGTVAGISGAIAIGDDEDWSRHGRPRSGVGRVFQGSPLPETLTVGEVMGLAVSTRANADALMTQFGLSAYATRFVSELSTGMRRILDLSVAAASSPKVLLLDEPASGLAQSEIEYLATVIRQWRDFFGGVVIMVEHDAWLVRAVADRVLLMEAGNFSADGTPDEVMDLVRSRTKPRLRNPTDPRFAAALHRVSEEAVAPIEIARRTVSAWTIMRLGLREFSAGMASVLLLGVLNRVLKVELGVSLGVVAAVLASYNLAAPLALGIGHRSDTRPIFGMRRIPYIIGGTLIAGAAVAAAPHLTAGFACSSTEVAAGFQGLQCVGIVGVAAAVALFIAMGIGMYGAGTVFLALLADIVPERERAHAVSLVYIELVLGVIAGVGLVGGVLGEDRPGQLPENTFTLFAVAGLLIVVLSTIAVWGKERRRAPSAEPAMRIKFSTAIRSIVSMSQARTFFAFSVLTSIFIFLQQAVLEPYGGDVLHLSVTTTSTFNAVMTIGVLAGMYTAGRPFTERYGHKTVARYGIVISAAAFGMLTLAAFARSAPPSWFAIFWIGIGTGVFSVAGLSLMMGMVDRRRTAIFMGAWTIARALADATAVAGGGAFFDGTKAALRRWAGFGETRAQAFAYAMVFGLEAVGLIACLPLLRRFDPARFAAEAAESEAALVPELEPAGTTGR